MKKMLAVFTLALVMAFSGSLALAQPSDDSSAPAPAFKKMSDEDHAAIAAMHKEYRQKITPLRDQMWAKRMEYKALVGNPNIKQADVQALVADMSKLRAQIRTEHEAYSDQLEAKGYAFGHGKNFGHRSWRGHCGDFGFDGEDGFGRGHGKHFAPKHGQKQGMKHGMKHGNW